MIEFCGGPGNAGLCAALGEQQAGQRYTFNLRCLAAELHVHFYGYFHFEVGIGAVVIKGLQPHNRTQARHFTSEDSGNPRRTNTLFNEILNNRWTRFLSTKNSASTVRMNNSRPALLMNRGENAFLSTTIIKNLMPFINGILIYLLIGGDGGGEDAGAEILDAWSMDGSFDAAESILVENSGKMVEVGEVREKRGWGNPDWRCLGT